MSLSNEPQPAGGREVAEWKNGGRTAAFALFGYGAGPVLLIITASVFVRPTMEATGWSTSEVLVSPVLVLLLSACGPIAGRLADRWGARKTIIAGLVPFSVILTLFALLPINKVTFYGLALASGIIGSFAYMVPFNRAVVSWFDKGAGKAFGLVGSGSAVMALIATPIVTLAIYNFGWQAGYLVLAGFVLLISLPAVVFGMQDRLRTNEVHGSSAESPDAARSVKQVLRTPRYWIFSFSIFAVTTATTGYLAHLQPILLDSGLSVAVATTVTTLYSVGTIAGRLLGGTLLDFFPRRKIAVAVSILLAAAFGSLVMIATGSVPIFIIAIAVILVALSQGAEADIGAYFVAKEYGPRNFGTLYSTALALSGVAAVASPYAFGAIRDASGSYMWACVVGAGGLVLAALSVLVFGMTGSRDPDPASEPPEQSSDRAPTATSEA
ncbi:hypothetical protein C1I97_03140 [Streptomyces sp. NTH33]|uniref:MFS transporter n=1 Tax=Streptomyces sp. NTH33 TaxID=1735453 RepID=UPI000DA87394|nr:MFS transporter [Streptomyces sp. NTH33]PZH18827.1 hypothetical protein C1I97_03140 [Streptomyces sp. NTH33]